MGTDCVPLLANVHLFSYEHNFMKSLLKNNIIRANHLSNSFRYIDDLLTVNNPSFKNEISNIYPSEFFYLFLYNYFYIFEYHMDLFLYHF